MKNTRTATANYIARTGSTINWCAAVDRDDLPSFAKGSLARSTPVPRIGAAALRCAARDTRQELLLDRSETARRSWPLQIAGCPRFRASKPGIGRVAHTFALFANVWGVRTTHLAASFSTRLELQNGKTRHTLEVSGITRQHLIVE